MTCRSFRAAESTAVVWHPDLLEYRHAPWHPMDPVRLELTVDLCREMGILDDPRISVLAPGVAADEDLLTVHSADYIEAVRAAGAQGTPSAAHGLGTEDNPVFDAIHTASARIVQGSLDCADAVLSGAASRAVNVAGGMHHAARSRAAGFCVYNDAAAAVRRLLDRGVPRVLYLDLDAHHGDGTESIFADEPRVMTISLHESGLSLFPGTGFPQDSGTGDAAGTTVNVALPAGTGDAGWLRAFHGVVPQLVEAFEPTVIVSQHGCDSHAADPLTDLRLSVDAQRQAAMDVAHLVEQHCGGRWIATGGGGYAVAAVVPRSWTQLTAVVAGCPIPLGAPTPEAWREQVRARCGVEAPERMDDGVHLGWRSWTHGHDPGDAVDRAVMLTRREIFPRHGLDPWFD